MTNRAISLLFLCTVCILLIVAYVDYRQSVADRDEGVPGFVEDDGTLLKRAPPDMPRPPKVPSDMSVGQHRIYHAGDPVPLWLEQFSGHNSEYMHIYFDQDTDVLRSKDGTFYVVPTHPDHSKNIMYSDCLLIGRKCEGALLSGGPTMLDWTGDHTPKE